MVVSTHHGVSSQSHGWTMMELLIVVAILGVLVALILFGSSKKSMYRANDARRKSDLGNIRRSFEEYYNDSGSYPGITILNTCNATTLSAYSLAKVPCDPTTKLPYKYIPDDETDLTRGNRICASLQDMSDPDIALIGCDPLAGCGWGAGWNYCLAAGTTITSAGFQPEHAEPTETPIPTPSPTPNYAGNYACTPGGACNYYDNPANHGCPVGWASACPAGACSVPSNRCND